MLTGLTHEEIENLKRPLAAAFLNERGYLHATTQNPLRMQVVEKL